MLKRNTWIDITFIQKFKIYIMFKVHLEVVFLLYLYTYLLYHQWTLTSSVFYNLYIFVFI